jgi:hypothetical protein
VVALRMTIDRGAANGGSSISVGDGGVQAILFDPPPSPPPALPLEGGGRGGRGVR